MCIDVRKTCECGARKVQFHLRDNLMQPEVIQRLFCPACPGNTAFDEQAMLNDNGWVIEYDMPLAKMLAASRLQLDMDAVNPGFIFDHGYACWLEMYPGEREEIKEEKDKIVALLKEDQKKYLEAIQRWNIERVSRLKAEGWRKALYS
ncbi:hypothetical protein ACUUL3_16450 [Thiovibrio sp. JS02]